MPEAPFTVNPSGHALLLWGLLWLVLVLPGMGIGWLAWRHVKGYLVHLGLLPEMVVDLKTVKEVQTNQSGAISALHTRMDKMSEQSRRQEVRTAERFTRIETKLSLAPLAADEDSGEHRPVGS